MIGIVRSTLQRMQFMNTARALKWDVTRMRARGRTRKMLRALESKGPMPKKFHFGSGSRKIDGWINSDITSTDVDIDLSCGTLPFASNSFELAVAQQVIEHLELKSELRPLLQEVHRCMAPGGEIWLSCPDMRKICRSYLEDGGSGLIKDKLSRWKTYSTGGYVESQVVNDLFHQWGQHKNLFDFELLSDLLSQVGFRDVQHRREADLLNRIPEFPPRNDDFNALYVSAIK